MAGFMNPESMRQMADRLSDLGKLSETVPTPDVKTTYAPLDKVTSVEGVYNRLPRTGSWDGEKGDSTWRPDRDDVPGSANPDGRTWGKILDDRGIDGIPFNDGEPDFSEVSKGTVEIDDFSTDRFGAGGNFDQADRKLAEQRGCTVEEVQQWRIENNYTWHEKQDCKTMQKVPRDVHHNVPHTGGVSVLRTKQSQE